jgi:hypothetical protein
VLKKPEDFTGKAARVQAPITAGAGPRCAGCTSAASSRRSSSSSRNAFLVPKEASGRTTIVEATMTMKQETVEQAKHYLEDAGKHDEAAKVTEGRQAAPLHGQRRRDQEGGEPTRGSAIVNEEPRPVPGLLALMEPPCNATISRTSARPMPMPPAARVIEPSAWRKLSKT